jgi:hypothetical protein
MWLVSRDMHISRTSLRICRRFPACCPWLLAGAVIKILSVTLGPWQRHGRLTLHVVVVYKDLVQLLASASNFLPETWVRCKGIALRHG